MPNRLDASPSPLYDHLFPSFRDIFDLCLGPYGGPRGWAFSYERGTPVRDEWGAVHAPANLAQTSIEDKFSDSMKIFTHLDLISL